jgi:hypothetical protein
MIGRRGMGSHGRIRRSKTHVLPLIDYSGEETLMVFQRRETCPLPPLYVFAIDFTHEDTVPGRIQPAEPLIAIGRDKSLENRCPFRLEVYLCACP